jgi:hypothetical protein
MVQVCVGAETRMIIFSLFLAAMRILASMTRMLTAPSSGHERQKAVAHHLGFWSLLRPSSGDQATS